MAFVAAALVIVIAQLVALAVEVLRESMRGRKLERERDLDFSETRKNTSSASSTFSVEFAAAMAEKAAAATFPSVFLAPAIFSKDDFLVNSVSAKLN